MTTTCSKHADAEETNTNCIYDINNSVVRRAYVTLRHMSFSVKFE